MEEFKEASGLVHKPSNYNSGDARSIVLMYDQEEVGILFHFVMLI